MSALHWCQNSRLGRSLVFIGVGLPIYWCNKKSVWCVRVRVRVRVRVKLRVRVRIRVRVRVRVRVRMLRC